MSESAIRHTIFWFWILLAVFAFVGVATLILNKPPKQAEIKPEVKPEEPPKEIPLDYTKLIGMHDDEAVCFLHNIPCPKHEENMTNPYEETWKIKGFKIKMAIVNDRVIGVQIGNMDWTGKDEMAR